MGGKTKQSQRTKNNVRPSSSSRSAGLLSSGVNLDGGLVTLSSGKTVPQLFPTLAATNLEQGLNPEFQMCIKKLNKKDPITRAKALQELCELVNSADVNDVVSALPSWAHFYKILSSDTDRKVREVTQVCHGAVVRVCGRRVAPQLRALLPAWLAAQHDAHAPAQAAAQHALKSTFPDSKLPEVITFCKAEVMAHLLDNLIGNAETVITKRIENAEDRELQLSRIKTSSLQGLEYFTQHLPREHDAWLWAQLAPLLQAAAFWRLAAAAPAVRAAWYAAVGRVLERFADAFGAAHGVKLARLLLEGAREHAAAVAAPLWTCLLQLMHHVQVLCRHPLQLMHHVQNWPVYIDKKELLVKRILDILENGGWGDARHLSTMLLPLLAHLPQDLLTKEFYEMFFKAVFSGLDKKNIINSKSERQAWITSLAECLRYMSIQEHSFVTEITTSVHRHWIERVLATQQDGQARTNLIKCSATNMASLVKYWLKQSKEENNEKYDQLVRNFWQNVGSTVLTQIDKSSSDDKEIEKVIEGHILLLQTLKSALTHDSKKQLNIKFDGDEVTQPERAPPAPHCDAAIVDRYKHNLDECVHKICSHYFESAEKKQVADPILTPLLTLLNEFDSENLFKAVARQFDEDSVYKLYEKVLRPWLCGDSMCRKSVVDIVFLLMKYMTEEEQDATFESFNQVGWEALEWCADASARHPAVRAAAARRWLRGARVAALLARLAADAAASPRAAALLQLLLAGAPDEPLVSAAGVQQVLQTAGEAVARTDLPLEAGAALAARLVCMLQDHAASDHYAQLVLNLFRLNILVPRGDGRLSLDTWCEVRSSWQDGLAALPPAPRARLLQRAAALVHDQLPRAVKNVDISKIENVISPCADLVWVGAGSEGAADMSRQLLARAPAARAPAAAALRHLCLSAQLCCLQHADDDIINAIALDSSNSDADDLTEAELVPYIHEFLFRAIYLRTLFLHKINSDDDDDEETNRKTWCDTLLQDEYLRDEFCQVLHDYIVIYFLDEGYKFWPHYDLIQLTKQKMDTLLEDVISATSEEVRSAVLGALTERALARGYLWALARRWYVLHAQPAAAAKCVERDQRQHDVACGNGFFHTLQANSKWCSDAEAQYRCKFLVMLHCWRGVHAAALQPAELQHALADAGARCDPDAVLNAYYRHNHTMLYDRDISDASWNEVLSNVTVVDFLTAMVETCGWDAPAHLWDFTTITMCSLLCSLEKSKHNWSCSKVAMLSRAVLRLFAAVRRFVRELRAECTRRQPAPHVADLMAEWTDIFAPDTHYNLFTIIVHVLESCTTMELSAHAHCVVEALSGGVELLEWPALGGAHRAGALALAGLARAAAAALLRPAPPPAKRLAFRLLQRLAAPLVLDDAERLTLWSDAGSADEDAEHERPELSLDYFHDAFTQLHEIVEAALGTVVLGEATCEFVATSDSYSMALGWLLLAEIIASVCQLARGDLYHHYLQIYRERKYVEPVLETALRLLPEELFASAGDAGPAAPPPRYQDMFLGLPDFSAAAGAEVPALACRGVFSALCGPGAGGARGWWGAAPARAARLLERLVRAYVAPAAARQQLRALQQRAAEIEDAEVRIAWSTNEVTCLYTVEDRIIELRVWLSPTHPLTPPRIAAADDFGPGANTHWIALYLAYQNGTILNALKMWTQAVSAKVESSPQCYICYCRLHPSTGRLPRVSCHQCKNKFHNMCLRKWFATSNKSNCPLCRSTF